jgi:hypothetical protein
MRKVCCLSATCQIQDSLFIGKPRSVHFYLRTLCLRSFQGFRNSSLATGCRGIHILVAACASKRGQHVGKPLVNISGVLRRKIFPISMIRNEKGSVGE